MSEEGFLKRLRRRKVEVVPERRRNLRTATVFQVAKLVAGGFEELCLLRDVSSTGLKAEVYYPLSLGDRVEIELKTEHRVSGEIVWVHEGAIGMNFDKEIPVLAMLAHCAFDDRVARIRPPRLNCTMPGTLAVEGRDCAVTVLNVSLAGMKMTFDCNPGDKKAIVTLPEFGRRACTIRWARGGEAGVMFDEPLIYTDFVEWRRRLLALDTTAAAA